MIVFDLDGTLADISHRRPLVEKKSRTGHAPDWRAFFAACTEDKPIKPVIELLRTLHHIDFRRVEIWSGRSDEVREQTVRWLNRHIFGLEDAEERVYLRMRPKNNTWPDEVLKEAWLDGEPPKSVELVIDDRDKVVAMWRRRGIVCLQAAPGDF